MGTWARCFLHCAGLVVGCVQSILPRCRFWPFGASISPFLQATAYKGLFHSLQIMEDLMKKRTSLSLSVCVRVCLIPNISKNSILLQESQCNRVPVHGTLCMAGSRWRIVQLNWIILCPSISVTRGKAYEKGLSCDKTPSRTAILCRYIDISPVN